MSKKLSSLHSHSALERELKFPKHFVLIDEQFKTMFLSSIVKPYRCNGRIYYQVPTLEFIRKGGVFKNLME